MFRFASPWFFLLLIPAWGFLIYTLKKEKTNTIHVSGLDGLSTVPTSVGARISGLLPWLKVLAVSCMILALARPQSGDEKINVMTEGVNIILALDLSESMRALDFKRDNEIITRL
ncbi:MAG: magnesium chelatase, partial [Deltaproteobacteria bacterium]